MTTSEADPSLTTVAARYDLTQRALPSPFRASAPHRLNYTEVLDHSI